MLARVLEDTALRAAASAESAVVTRLAAGTVIEVAESAARGVSSWDAAVALDGRKGFVARETRLERVPEETLAQREAPLRDAPGPDGNPVRTLKRGASFHVLERVEARDGTGWLRVRQPSGGSGFLSERTKRRALGGGPATGGGGAFALEKAAMDRGVVGGLLLMLGAVVWFVGGWMAGVIFYYPPVLFVLGLFAFVRGMVRGQLTGADVVRRLRNPWALGVGLAVLAVAAWAAIERPWEASPRIWVVNGLPRAVVVSVDDEVRTLAPGTTVSVTRPRGTRTLVARTADGRVLERMEVSLPRGEFAAWNVLGAAPLVIGEVEYRATRPSGKEAEPEPRVEHLAGLPWVVRPFVDDPFVEPPQTVKMSGKRSVRRTSLVLDGGWQSAVTGVAAREGPAKAADLASRVAIGVGDEEVLALAGTVAGWTGPERLLRFGEEATAAWPRSVEAGRARQSGLEALGRVEEARAAARAEHAKAPDSPDAAYLLARVVPRAEAERILVRALAAHPKHPWVLRLLASSRLASRDFAEALALYERLEKDGGYVHGDAFEDHVAALVATGAVRRAQTRLRDAARTDMGLLPCYARVARLPGADPALPTLEALVGEAVSEEAERGAILASAYALARDPDGYAKHRDRLPDADERAAGDVQAACGGAAAPAGAALAAAAAEPVLRRLDPVTRVAVVCELLRRGEDAAAKRVHATPGAVLAREYGLDALRRPAALVLEAHTPDLRAVLARAAALASEDAEERARNEDVARGLDVFRTFSAR